MLVCIMDASAKRKAPVTYGGSKFVYQRVASDRSCSYGCTYEAANAPESHQTRLLLNLPCSLRLHLVLPAFRRSACLLRVKLLQRPPSAPPSTLLHRLCIPRSVKRALHRRKSVQAKIQSAKLSSGSSPSQSRSSSFCLSATPHRIHPFIAKNVECLTLGPPKTPSCMQSITNV